MFEGCTVAMITPFKNGSLDVDGIKNNVNFYIDNGINGILIAGTTGESPSLTDKEYKTLIDTVVKTINGRVKVMLNIGTNSTEKTKQNTQIANDSGVDANLVITPYYNKPNYSGMKEHFLIIAKLSDNPIYIYNVPGRTGSNIETGLVSILEKESDNIVGIKEASGNIDRVSELSLICSANFEILSGDDSLTLPAMSVGAKGVISVIANIVPDRITKMIKYALDGMWDEARVIHKDVFHLTKALFIETNPVPVKTAMNLIGRSGGDLRLPLGPMQITNKNILIDELKTLNLV